MVCPVILKIKSLSLKRLIREHVLIFVACLVRVNIIKQDVVFFVALVVASKYFVTQCCHLLRFGLHHDLGCGGRQGAGRLELATGSLREIVRVVRLLSALDLLWRCINHPCMEVFALQVDNLHLEIKALENASSI